MSERKVATDALETLGTVIDETQKRDAIHLAVEPVIASTDLAPGQHITVERGYAHATAVGEGLGIVDPFLPERVKAGQRFWFVMYPRMVHSLRHVWSHPAFVDELSTTPASRCSKDESEKWLRDYTATADCPGYEKVMELIQQGSLPSPDSEYYETGGEYTEDYLFFGGSDAHGEIPSEFWDHVENVLGRKVPHRSKTFACSC